MVVVVGGALGYSMVAVGGLDFGFGFGYWFWVVLVWV